MKFRNYFLLSSFAFVATGFLALVLTGRLDVISPVLYVAAVVGAWWIERNRPDLLIARKRAAMISAIAIPLTVVDILIVTRNPFLGLARFALLLAAIKLFQKKDDSDWVWLYGLAFGQLLLAASLTVDATFLVSLMLFLFFLVTTLSAFEIERTHRKLNRVEEEEFAMRADRPRPLRRGWFVSAIGGGQMVLVALLAVPIFFLLPRFGGGYLGSAYSQSQTLSGFSERVNLGDLENIKLNRTVVMYVKLDRPPNRPLRWRGLVLEEFDGTRGAWKAVRPFRGTTVERVPGVPSRFDVEPLAPGTVASDLLEQTIYLEPMSNQTLFAASRAKRIDNAPREVAVDGTGSLRGPRHHTSRLSYVVTSDVVGPSESELAQDTSTDYPEDVRTLDLQLPAIDPRVAELARSVIDDAVTPHDKARRIELYLKNQFEYSLELTRQDTSIDPVADFLINVRRGHCEYFATSMAIMLRSVGVPSRVVNGFQTGEYNAISETYTVRQADAHSWVEVYFAGSNEWIEFDPTPAAGLNSYDPSLAADLRKSIEAMQLVWIRYVVALDTHEQLSIFRSIQGGLIEAKTWVTTKFASFRRAIAEMFEGRSGTSSMPGALTVIVVAMLGVGALSISGMLLHHRGWRIGRFVFPVWRWRRWWDRSPEPSQKAAVHFYEQMCAMLDRAGIHRQPFTTPREFGVECGLDEVRTITEHYHRVRFGGETSHSVERDVASALASLASTLRKPRKAQAPETPTAAPESGTPGGRIGKVRPK